MEKDQKINSRFGLVGKDISYSFSKQYFFEKFKALKLKDHAYQNFDLSTIKDFPNLIAKTQHLKGLNVTIPYKEAVIHYLDELDEQAREIGAVNTIKLLKNKRLRGYNTDAYGFEKSIVPFLKNHHRKALILGTGGASKAINFVLKKMCIAVVYVSRTPKNKNVMAYTELSKSILASHTVIVNCTPVGTYPAIDECPDIPYQYLTDRHVLYDLVYNPSRTQFLKKGLQQHAQVCNGLNMLEFQAEKAWEIWNS